MCEVNCKRRAVVVTGATISCAGSGPGSASSGLRDLSLTSLRLACSRGAAKETENRAGKEDGDCANDHVLLILIRPITRLRVPRLDFRITVGFVRITVKIIIVQSFGTRNIVIVDRSHESALTPAVEVGGAKKIGVRIGVHTWDN